MWTKDAPKVSVWNGFETCTTSVIIYPSCQPDGALSQPRIVPLGLSLDAQISCLCSLTDASSMLQSLCKQNQKESKEAQNIFHSQNYNYFSK